MEADDNKKLLHGRPSSAAPRLQSHPVYCSTLLTQESTYSDKTETFNRSASAKLSSSRWVSVKTVSSRRPKSSVRARSVMCVQRGDISPQGVQGGGLRWQERRLTVTGADLAHLSATVKNLRNQKSARLASKRRGKIENMFSIEMLDELKEAFSLADTTGDGKLDYENFWDILSTHLHLSPTQETQVLELFQKIDHDSHGCISWDDFCSYMHLEYAERERLRDRALEVSVCVPARSAPLSKHQHPVQRVLVHPLYRDGSFMTCARDGTMTFWSAELKSKTSRVLSVSGQTGRGVRSSKWITDVVLMPQYNKLITGTGDREIQFYELLTFEPYCQMHGFSTVPLCIDYSNIGHNECLVLFGDKEGCVNILHLVTAGELLRQWKKGSSIESISSMPVEVAMLDSRFRFLRWKVHTDWIQQIRYFHDLRQVVSCCNNEATALVIGNPFASNQLQRRRSELIRHQMATANERSGKCLRSQSTHLAPYVRDRTSESVFHIYKGVRSFDFCKRKNIVVTGGLDRVVRVWNPYVANKPIALLRGHGSPITHIFISADDNRIFSLSTDRCLRVWDSLDHQPLLIVRSKSHKINGEIQAAVYSPVSRTIAIVTDRMNTLSVRLKVTVQSDVPLTHNEPIRAIVYNRNFLQIITCSDASLVKLWDVSSGAAIFQFSSAHGDQPITCMTLDNTGRRLITGGRDGCVRIWNHNNGRCLKILRKARDIKEICDVTYVEVNKNRYVIAVGWDRHVNIYVDTAEDSRKVQHPLPCWGDDLCYGHAEDILSVAACLPNFLATSSYGGEIIVWNLVSGHVFARLALTDSCQTATAAVTRAPAAPTCNMTASSVAEDRDLSVSSVMFFKLRATRTEAACLVSSGPLGVIHFWNIYWGGRLMGRALPPQTHAFNGQPQDKKRFATVTSLSTNRKETLLISADSEGFICVWDTSNYCLTHSHTNNPPLLKRWRGHKEPITSVIVIEDEEPRDQGEESDGLILATSSLDGAVRLWTQPGHYIGVLGQRARWCLNNTRTYQHPMVPYDVLIDPLSLPSLPQELGDQQQEQYQKQTQQSNETHKKQHKEHQKIYKQQHRKLYKLRDDKRELEKLENREQVLNHHTNNQLEEQPESCDLQLKQQNETMKHEQPEQHIDKQNGIRSEVLKVNHLTDVKSSGAQLERVGGIQRDNDIKQTSDIHSNGMCVVGQHVGVGDGRNVELSNIKGATSGEQMYAIWKGKRAEGIVASKPVQSESIIGGRKISTNINNLNNLITSDTEIASSHANCSNITGNVIMAPATNIEGPNGGICGRLNNSIVADDVVDLCNDDNDLDVDKSLEKVITGEIHIPESVKGSLIKQMSITQVDIFDEFSLVSPEESRAAIEPEIAQPIASTVLDQCIDSVMHTVVVVSSAVDNCGAAISVQIAENAAGATVISTSGGQASAARNQIASLYTDIEIIRSESIAGQIRNSAVVTTQKGMIEKTNEARSLTHQLSFSGLATVSTQSPDIVNFTAMEARSPTAVTSAEKYYVTNDAASAEENATADETTVAAEASDAVAARSEARSEGITHRQANQNSEVTDEGVPALLLDQSFRVASGKRLRHERCKPVQIDHGGPSEYHTLQCYDLNEILHVEPPQCLNKARDSMDLSGSAV